MTDDRDKKSSMFLVFLEDCDMRHPTSSSRDLSGTFWNYGKITIFHGKISNSQITMENHHVYHRFRIDFLDFRVHSLSMVAPWIPRSFSGTSRDALGSSCCWRSPKPCVLPSLAPCWCTSVGGPAAWGSLYGSQVEDTLWLCQNSYWKSPFIVNFPRKMVIFHSYVKLPEGNWNRIWCNLDTTGIELGLKMTLF